MYCDGSITIMWSLNVFINDFPLPCRQVKINIFKILDSDVLFLSSVFQVHLRLIATLSYSKLFEII